MTRSISRYFCSEIQSQPTIHDGFLEPDKGQRDFKRQPHKSESKKFPRPLPLAISAPIIAFCHTLYTLSHDKRVGLLCFPPNQYRIVDGMYRVLPFYWHNCHWSHDRVVPAASCMDLWHCGSAVVRFCCVSVWGEWRQSVQVTCCLVLWCHE